MAKIDRDAAVAVIFHRYEQAAQRWKESGEAREFGAMIELDRAGLELSRLPVEEDRPAFRWIPCEDALPEELEEVNVTWVNHDPAPYYDFCKDKPNTATAVYYKKNWYWFSSVCVDLLAEYGRNPADEIDDGIEIIAWMPLPEPYKEEQDEQGAG